MNPDPEGVRRNRSRMVLDSLRIYKGGHTKSTSKSYSYPSHYNRGIADESFGTPGYL